jgi:hypothetical protein
MMRCCCFLLTVMTLAAQSPNLTGSWTLNVEKSSWGRKAKPQSVTVNVNQSNQSLKYSGDTVDFDGKQSTYDVDVPVDGQQHPVKTSYGPGQMVVKRSNPYTITSDFHSDDGKFQETATTTVSQDGRTMTRRMHTKGPDGEASWTELYERH